MADSKTRETAEVLGSHGLHIEPIDLDPTVQMLHELHRTLKALTSALTGVGVQVNGRWPEAINDELLRLERLRVDSDSHTPNAAWLREHCPSFDLLDSIYDCSSEGCRRGFKDKADMRFHLAMWTRYNKIDPSYMKKQLDRRG